MTNLRLRHVIISLIAISLLLVFCACEGEHTHTPGEWIVDVEAECTRGGSRHNECTSCGIVVKIENIPALGHDEVTHAAKAPTCAEIGWNAYVTCSRCDYTTYAEKAATGHTEEKLVGKSATCTEDGLTDGVKCSVCDKVLTAQESISALGHDEVTHEAKAPTCTEIGWDAYVTCSRCDHTTYVEKAAKGHIEAVYHGYAATCTENGLADGVKCSECEEILNERDTISATGHKYDNDKDTECNNCGNIRDVSCKHKVTVHVSGYAPTCTEDGLTDGARCLECGEFTTVQKIILAKGHFTSSDKWLTILLPTCTEDGTKAKNCSVCNNYTAYQEIDVLGHDEKSHSAKAPTCTEIGWDAYVTCTRCDYTTYAEKAALGHDEEAHESKAPTCTESGWDAYVTCTRCDYTTYAEKSVINHSWSDATCMLPAICSVCGSTDGEALGHNYVNNTCRRCGKDRVSEGLKFTSYGDGKTCYVSGIGDCKDEDLVIPSVSPEGYTVTGIGLLAFYNCSSLRSVIMPDSVTRIGQEAFSYCSGLESIIIPDSVKIIAPYAFEYCSSLTIYCEAESKPGGWDSYWNYSNRPVVWGYKEVDS